MVQTQQSEMNILVIGSGGREHAIVHYLAASPLSSAVYAAPGNGGTATEPKTTNVSLNGEDADAVVEFALANDIGLVVIGPEAPLVKGVADAVRAAGILAFGPGAQGAQLEGSKAFAKDFMVRHNIPTAAYHTFTADQKLEAYETLQEMGAPVVIKADGLAAGKGVTVAMDMATAQQALDECFNGRFGEAGETVVIEQYLDGPECSMLVFVEGDTMVPLAPAQDHKRVGDGDAGPNTGGMGVYSPVPLLYRDEYVRMLDIMQEMAVALKEEDIDFRGVLYGGFILTEEGPEVLEFNVRFGDPETQVLLPRLKSDLVEVMCAVAEGRLADVNLRWDLLDGVSVVMASAGYPGSYEKGKVITGIDVANAMEDVAVFQAGTALNERGEIVTAGGRVLNVTALAPDFEEAIVRAYDAVSKISFEGAFYRHDIGQKALTPRKEL